MEPAQSQNGAEIWLIGGDKGGAGKSTISACVAAAIASVLKRPIQLIDTDVQTRDVSSWLTTRQRDWPNLPPIQGLIETEEVGEKSCAARDAGQFVVLDVGGRDSEQLRVAMSVADLLLMPIQPSQFDLFSCKRMARRVAEVRRWNPKLRAWFFINRADTKNVLQHLNDEAHELCRSFGPTVQTADIRVHERVAFKYAARDGLGVLELKSADKAATEFWELLVEVSPLFAAQADVLPRAKAEPKQSQNGATVEP
jgi:chromosome partitioning protein